MIKIYCEGCDEYFKVEKFEKGITKCPSCDLTSLLREEAIEDDPSSTILEKSPKSFYVCNACKLSWSNLETKKCPKCKSTKLHLEYRMT